MEHLGRTTQSIGSLKIRNNKQCWIDASSLTWPDKRTVQLLGCRCPCCTLPPSICRSRRCPRANAICRAVGTASPTDVAQAPGGTTTCFRPLKRRIRIGMGILTAPSMACTSNGSPVKSFVYVLMPLPPQPPCQCAFVQDFGSDPAPGSADRGAVSLYSRAKTAPKSGAVLKTAPKWRHPKLKVRYFEHVFHH